MKQFFNYFKVLSNSSQPKSASGMPIISVVFVYLIGILLGKENVWISLLSVLAYISGVILFYTCCNSPNMEKVFPANHRKKLLYRFLSSLLFFLMAVAVIIAVLTVIMLIVMIFDFAAVSKFFDTSKASFSSVGVYGGLSGLAYFIILYSAGVLLGFIKKRSRRNIFLIVFCIALFFSDFFMLLPYYYANGNFGGAGLLFSESCYKAMAMPYLATVFWFIAAAGMLGTAVYLGMKYYDPEKF